jgi:hypothetical protein
LTVLVVGGFRQRGPIQGTWDVSSGPPTGAAMQGHPAAGSIFGAGPFRGSFNRGGTTGGTNQRFLVPIRGDQNQCFRSPVLLDAPTTHGRPFRQGASRACLANPAQFSI